MVSLQEGLGEVTLTEMAIDQKLTALRAQQPLYRDISFDTILRLSGTWGYCPL